MMPSHLPITTPDPGCETCYECDGKCVCWSCDGAGKRTSGTRCNICVGTGRCIVCTGDGQLPAGARKAADPIVERPRIARIVGQLRELGDETAPTLADLRGKRSPMHQAKVVAYLRAGKVLVMSPGLVRDPVDQRTLAGKCSIRTDGTYAWPDALAYFVETYRIELSAEFELHMAALAWKMPSAINLKGLVPG